jgi:N-acetylneuraminate synthase
VDSAFSLEPEEFARLREETEHAWQGIGEVIYGGTEAEEKSKAFRRSLYIARDLAAGDLLTSDNVRVVRPGFGLPPKFLGIVVGRRLSKPASAGTPVTWDLLT